MCAGKRSQDLPALQLDRFWQTTKWNQRTVTKCLWSDWKCAKDKNFTRNLFRRLCTEVMKQSEVAADLAFPWIHNDSIRKQELGQECGIYPALQLSSTMLIGHLRVSRNLSHINEYVVTYHTDFGDCCEMFFAYRPLPLWCFHPPTPRGAVITERTGEGG